MAARVLVGCKRYHSLASACRLLRRHANFSSSDSLPASLQKSSISSKKSSILPVPTKESSLIDRALNCLVSIFNAASAILSSSLALSCMFKNWSKSSMSTPKFLAAWRVNFIMWFCGVAMSCGRCPGCSSSSWWWCFHLRPRFCDSDVTGVCEASGLSYMYLPWWFHVQCRWYWLAVDKPWRRVTTLSTPSIPSAVRRCRTRRQWRRRSADAQRQAQLSKISVYRKKRIPTICKRAFFRVSSRRMNTLSIHRGLFRYVSNWGIIHNTHTITRLPQRIHLYSIVSWQRLPAHTHQASLVPHIRSHLHNPSSRIHIFAELHVGSLWLVGTPWHTFVYPSLDK